MPEGYTRSRARFTADSSGGRGYAPRPRGNGLMVALVVVVIAGLLVGAGFIFKDTIAELLGAGGRNPTPAPTVADTATPEPTATIEPTATPAAESTATATPAAEPTATPAAVEDVTVSVVGDILVDAKELNDAKDDSGNYDFAPFFANVKDSLAKSDLVLGTLETTLYGTDKKYSGSPKYNTPDSILAALKDAGFKVLDIAHTHSFDYGFKGAETTKQKITDQGMFSTGIYTSTEDYHTPLLLQAKSMRISVISFSEGETYASSVSAENMRYAVKHISLDSIKKGIGEAKTAGAQIVIVMLHWGKNTTTAPSSDMKTLAKGILENGADVVIGSGPQYVQKIERVTVTRDGAEFTGLVAYSLGSFVSGETAEKKDSSLILNLTFEKDNVSNAITLKNVTYVPTYVYSKSGQDFAILPTGKYKDSQDLLGTLSATGKSRVPKAWQDIVDAVANGDIAPSAE